MSESGSIADLSQHTVMPYAERGWIFASPVVMHVCIYAAKDVGDDQAVIIDVCGGRPVLPGSQKVDYHYTKISFAFLPIWRCNTASASTQLELQLP